MAQHVVKKSLSERLVPGFLKSTGQNRPIIFMMTGAVLTIVVGFSWGGWHLGSTVSKLVAEAQTAGRIEAPTQACAAAIMANETALTAFKAASYNKDNVVNKFVKAPDGKELPYDVSRACVTAVTAAVEAKSKKM